MCNNNIKTDINVNNPIFISISTALAAEEYKTVFKVTCIHKRCLYDKNPESVLVFLCIPLYSVHVQCITSAFTTNILYSVHLISFITLQNFKSLLRH